jgi:hypothetical protein
MGAEHVAQLAELVQAGGEVEILGEQQRLGSHQT